VTRGIAIADVDGDGDLDFAVANQWGPSTFFRNDLAGANTSLTLRLLLPTGPAEASATDVYAGHVTGGRPTHPAVGATATVSVPRLTREARAPGDRVMVGQVDGGNGHSGKRSPELHFGLGRVPSDQALRVALRWRDGRGRINAVTRWMKPGWYTVVLGSGQVEH
jgi:hypothetical protein